MLMAYFRYPFELGKLMYMYTTNIIESSTIKFGKVTDRKGYFPMKCLFLKAFIWLFWGLRGNGTGGLSGIRTLFTGSCQ